MLKSDPIIGRVNLRRYGFHRRRVQTCMRIAQICSKTISSGWNVSMSEARLQRPLLGNVTEPSTDSFWPEADKRRAFRPSCRR